MKIYDVQNEDLKKKNHVRNRFNSADISIFTRNYQFLFYRETNIKTKLSFLICYFFNFY